MMPQRLLTILIDVNYVCMHNLTEEQLPVYAGKGVIYTYMCVYIHISKILYTFIILHRNIIH